ncbi:TPA: deoxyhypusine synthase family protein [Candidatus Woesearchaeota archaeon]|nr:deoxyhypusine synthase family protein [Candidatus Woesearchaeota archaeon]
MKLKPLTPIDLRRCNTVDDIVSAMSKSSFGARMLGEMAESLTENAGKTALVYEGKLSTPLGQLVCQLVEKGYFTRLLFPEDYAKTKDRQVLVVGDYSERHEDAIHTLPDRAWFINNQGKARPGQVQDGFFPDALFTDPRYAMPLLAHILDARLEGRQQDVKAFLAELPRYGGLSAKVADGAETLKTMIDDKDCTVFMTMSGAMTIAQMGLVITDLMESGAVQSFTTTGAAMAHGLVDSLGLHHYKHDPSVDDDALAKMCINRVTDTYEPETNLDHIEQAVSEVLNAYPWKTLSPSDFHEALGMHLAEKYPGERGILIAAYQKGVPVFVPAFYDSELGNDFCTFNWNSQEKLEVDMDADNRKLVKLVQDSKKTGIFTIGGGVPRNWTQNVGPLIEILNSRTDAGLTERPFSYGVRVCPDQMYYGHLSGCTYSEGMTWRKMDPKGRFTEVQADATLVLPFMAKYVLG